MVNLDAVYEDMKGKADRVRAYHKDKKGETPMDKDNMLMQPMENWERKDREGRYGQALFVLPGSRRYQENFDKIDWSK